MFTELMQLGIFTAKALIIVLLILVCLAGILALFARGKEKTCGKICVKNLNEKFKKTTETLNSEILSKDNFKKWLKETKREQKQKAKKAVTKNVFVLNFHGDINASAVAALSEEVTAIIGIAKKGDEVTVRLESAGGVVHAYGLAAAQLQRFRQKNIPLTVIVDKVAASGGYMMASIANKIVAAPFAIIGSIGVVVQLPNFHRLLKEKNIDFEQLTAGNFKRTLTIFGQNTDEGRDKLQQEIEEIHHLFKNLIKDHRNQLDIEKVSTGEHWLGTQAYDLKLVDDLQTSDDYLLAKSHDANVFEIKYQTKKTLAQKLTGAVNMLMRTSPI